jgi:CIC family chloride channel protein
MGPDPLYEVRAYSLVSPWEVGPYLGLGVVCGLFAPTYLRFLRRSEQFFARLRLHLIAKLAAGGAVVGALAVVQPEVAGNGRTVVMSLLSDPWTWKAVLVILISKVVATAATFGSGAVGGVFTPTLLAGAAVGHLYGVTMTTLMPGALLEPRAYALVGMGAFLAASTGAPIMALIMLFELTLDYSIILPLMLAIVVSYFVCRTMERQFLYGEALERKGAPAAARVLAGLRMMDLVKPNPVRVPIAARFREVAQAFLHHHFNYLYVVDEHGRYVGVISLHDVKEYLDETRDLEAVIAADLMRHDFPALSSDQSLLEAVEAFEHTRSERIPVVESREEPRLLGSLSKTDLLRHMMQAPGRA